MIPMPSRFDSLPLSPAILQVVAELGFERLTPIQARSIPVLLEGRDLIGQSRTGSGKTAAFALPILQRLAEAEDLQRNRRLTALVLCPTRELCTQVAREMRRLGRRHPGLQILILSGGLPTFPQLAALEKGVHVVVGTPGRVLDHLGRGSLDLSGVSQLVLDEADRMLDMGFQEDMERILAALPERRQTALFSATFPRTIEALSRAFQKDPVRVTIEETPESKPDIEQVLHEVDVPEATGPDAPALDPREAKLDALIRAIERHRPGSAIVFCNLKATVAELARALEHEGFSADALHGDLEQRDRDRVMAKFRNQSVRVLVATDVAARGIDVASLDLVVNFDLPPDPEVYVHRIGRTGRAGRKGLAISLATPRERAKVQNIERYTGKALERRELEPAEAPGLASKAAPTDAAMVTLYISGGRKDKMRPGDILGALTGEAGGLEGSDVGKIEIHDRFSYVAVAQAIAQTALTRLRNGRIKGRKFRVERVR